MKICNLFVYKVLYFVVVFDVLLYYGEISFEGFVDLLEFLRMQNVYVRLVILGVVEVNVFGNVEIVLEFLIKMF